MSNKATNTTKHQNIDTSSGKIENFEQESKTKAVQLSMQETANSENLQYDDVNSTSKSILQQKSLENSINNTNNSANIELTSKAQNSDTSKNILDPLSEIDTQGNIENSASNAKNEDENLVFLKLFPNVSLEKLKQDELFCLFSSHNGKNLTISDLYTNYLQLVNALSEDFAKKSLVSLQNKLSSPGSLATSEKTGEIFFTKEQVLKMSPEQISKNFNYIRKSQQKW